MWERNRLLAFFVQNGVDPTIAGELVLFPNTYSYRRQFGHRCSNKLDVGYDLPATRDIQDQVRVYNGPDSSRKRNLFNAYRVYNFASGRVE